MGYFSSAYSIFMPVYAISVTGLPAAVARSAAAAHALGKGDEAESVKRIALKLFGAVGLAASLVIMLAAYPFCKYITDDMYALPSVLVIAPSVIAGCLVSVYRGYYEGMRNMYPTAISQVTEAAAKLVFGLALCGGCLYTAEKYPDEFLRFTGCAGRGISASDAAVPYSAAAAVSGITLSSFAGLLYIVCYSKRSKSTKVLTKNNPPSDSRQILSDLLKTALPAAVGALVTNLTSLIDLVTIMSSLRYLVKKSPWVFSELLGAGISYDMIPTFIYGSFMGLAVTLFNLVPSVTNMFGKSMLPAAAAAAAAGDGQRLRECSHAALFASAAVSVPAGIGMSVMAGPILNLLFGGRTPEIAVSTVPTAVLGLAVPFLCISSTAFALLQAAGRADIPVKLMGVGAAVKLCGNMLLTLIPSVGVTGAAWSTLICYMLIFVMSAAVLRKHVYLDTVRFLSDTAKLCAGGIMCGAGAFFMHNALSGRVGETISVIISCAFGAIIYIIITYFSGVITKSTLKTLIS